jgi:hypothetical protein
MTDLADAKHMSDRMLMLLLFTSGTARFQSMLVARFMMQATWVIHDGK